VTWAIGGGVILALLSIVIWMARREGRASAQRDAAATGTERARKANEIDEDVRRLDDRALDRELRDPAER